jgi:hypothetical protein
MADIVEEFANYRIRQVEIANAEYYEQLIRTLDNIERKIANLLNKKLPIQKGKLFELKSAISFQPEIRKVLDEEYLLWADKVVRQGFNKQAKRVEKAFKKIGNIPVEFQQLTKADLTLIQNLKRQAFTQFKDISNTFTRTLNQKVYQYTLLGNSPAELERELRQTINGIYARADQREIRKLVDQIKLDDIKYRGLDKRTALAKELRKKIDKNISILQSQYASDRAGENMKKYSGQLLNDTLSDFDAELNYFKSDQAGLKMVKYFGSIIATTRDHCALVRNGRYDKRKSGLFTIDEVKALWRRKSWSGKKSGDPLIVRGGYNCRHQWSYVNPDWYDDNGELIIE